MSKHVMHNVCVVRLCLGGCALGITLTSAKHQANANACQLQGAHCGLEMTPACSLHGVRHEGMEST